MTTHSLPLLEVSVSDATIARDVLASVEAFDGVSHTEYTLVAIKETHRTSGSWWVRVNAHDGADSVFHPNAIRLQARAATAEGRTSFAWGRGRIPTARDARRISLRVHVRAGEPLNVEMTLRMRRFDHSADEIRSVIFPWPSA